MVIWKFPLFVTDSLDLLMPEGAVILSVQNQRDSLCLWAFCDPSAPLKSKKINIYGTGNPVPENPGRYIGTVQMDDGFLVWHVFQSP